MSPRLLLFSTMCRRGKVHWPGGSWWVPQSSLWTPMNPSKKSLQPKNIGEGTCVRPISWDGCQLSSRVWASSFTTYNWENYWLGFSPHCALQWYHGADLLEDQSISLIRVWTSTNLDSLVFGEALPRPLWLALVEWDTLILPLSRSDLVQYPFIQNCFSFSVYKESVCCRI